MGTNDIITILTSKDREEIKEGIKSAIVNQFKEELEDCDTYLFDVSDIQEMVNDAVRDALYEMYNEIKKAVKKKVKQLINDMSLNDIKGE